MTGTTEPIEILLVEDNPADIEVTRKALQQSGVRNVLRVVRDGQEALDYLLHEGKYADEAPDLPGLVLLDIGLPRVSGHEVLRRMKTEPALREIPVIMLTVSEDDEDIIRSYQYGTSVYIQKPMDPRSFIDSVMALGKYCLYICRVCDSEGSSS